VDIPVRAGGVPQRRAPEWRSSRGGRVTGENGRETGAGGGSLVPAGAVATGRSIFGGGVNQSDTAGVSSVRISATSGFWR
jgi:hypothetical protein